MPPWSDDDKLFQLMRSELYTAVVGDVMDVVGLHHQFLPPQIRPLKDDMIVVGRAMTVLEADCHGQMVAHSERREPFGLMFDALDDLKPNEVYICTGASPTYALWGELMTERALKLEAAGAVLNGFSRDTRGVSRLNFPTFSWGNYAQDQGIRGRVIDYRCKIEFQNQVTVSPGDIVFGDIDGVVIVPRDYEEDVIERALEKTRTENKVRTAIRSGMSAREAFEKYGVM